MANHIGPRPKAGGIGLNYTQLETRRLLAGDVNVFQHEGLLYIRGDTDANQIEISTNDDGDVKVVGVEGTTINDLDQAFVLDTENGLISGGLRVNMGRGDDSIFIDGVQVEDRAVVFGSWGNDRVGIYQTQVEQDLMVQTFFGDDSISIDEVEVGGQLLLMSLHDDDTLGIGDSLIAGRTIVITGHGNDLLAMKNSTLQGSAHFLTLNGDDFIGVNNMVVTGRTTMITGTGADDVFLQDSTFESRFFANGVTNQTGDDNLEVAGETTFSDTPRIINFEGSEVADGMQRTEDVFNSLILDGARLGTITEIAALTPELSTLTNALISTGLDSVLNQPGSLTAFAPLDSAFEDVSDIISGMTDQELSDLLKFHVSPTAILSDELVTLDSVDTLLGSPFSVDVVADEVLLNGGATISATDIRAKNGVIHLLNDVLIPS